MITKINIKTLITIATFTGATCMPILASAEAGAEASAETSGPTVYGRIRLALQNTDAKGINVDDFTSRFGIKGRVDSFFEGATILYKGEWDFKENSEDDAAQLGRTRLFYIGITGAYGTVKVGQVWSPYWLMTAEDVAPEFETKQLQLTMFSPTILPFRNGNSVIYISPKVRGFQASFLIQGDSDSETAEDGIDQYQGGFNYTIGGFKVGAAFVRNELSTDADRATISASYKVDGLKVGALYSSVEHDGGDTNPWSVMTSYKWDRTTLIGMYYDDDDTVAANTFQNGWGLELQYQISKKTMIFTSFGENGFNNDGSVTSLGTRIDF